MRQQAAESGLTNTAVLLPQSTIQDIIAYNPNGSTVFLQFWDATSAPTVGTTAPNKVIPIAATSTYSQPYDETISALNNLYVAATTTASGGSAPGSNVDFSYDYVTG